MSRTRQRNKIIHTPAIHEILHSLTTMPEWCLVLYENGSSHHYKPFMHWLMSHNFFSASISKTTIKWMASTFGATPLQVTKWLKEMYSDIFDLNSEKPELFVSEDQHKVLLYLSRYDSSCSVYVSLPAIPRKYDSFRFPFVRGRLGTDYFWVKEVEHELISDPVINIHLRYGFVNTYREVLLGKALFFDLIDWRDIYEKYDFELDEDLKRLFRPY
jgi:hypothetical protein